MRFEYTELALVPVVAVILAGCSAVTPSERVQQMGELITVGPIIYNVLETEWRAGLGEAISQSIPEDRYLLIRMTITNSGDRDVAIPLLTLEDQDGNTYLEESSVEGLSGWLGLLRVVQPAGTLQGQAVFDVPVGDYMLRVTDGGELESEKTALVEIPLAFGARDPLQNIPSTIME